MFRSFLSLLFAFTCFFFYDAQSQEARQWFTWKESKQLPVALSGAITGLSNGALMVAGGSNFPESITTGGKKRIYDDIYVCTNPDADSLTWINAGKLPYSLSDAAVIPHANGLLCIGGFDGINATNKVFHISWNRQSKKVEINLRFADLPEARSAASAVKLADKIFVAGGKDAQNVAAADFLWLELPGSEITSAKRSAWQKGASWPGPARFGAMMVVQSNGEKNFLYLAGGKSGNTYLKDVYRFDPYLKQNQWKKLKDMPRPALFASAMKYGQTHILVFSGSDGHDAEKAVAMGDQYKMVSDIIAYHTITDTWVPVGNLPGGVAAAGIVNVGDNITIIGGELRPGVRTATILSGTPKVVALKSNFALMDYLIIIVYLAVLGGISFYFSRKKNTTDDYLRGGQRIPYWAVGMSVMATQVSAIGFMSIPAKSYAINWNYFSGVFTWFLVVPIVTWAFIPFFRKLDVTSAYEYLEKRFNEFIRLFSGFIYCVYQLGRMGLIVYLPAVALSAVAPIDTFTCILIMGVLSTAYTVVGGIEAVIWIEVLQVTLLMGGAITCVVLAVTGIEGGVSGFVDIAMANDKFSFGAMDFDFTSSVLGVVLIGNIFTRLGNLISDQAIVQRYMTTKDLKTSRKSLWMDVIVSIPWAIIIYLLGTSLYVFYKSNPGLLNPSVPTDGILPQFISQQAPSGLSGLIIAAIFAAAMANIESHIHSMATIVTTDFYGRFSRSATEKNKLKFARVSTAILGVVATCLAMLLLTIDIKSILDVFTEMTGLFLGAAAGLFLLGIFTEKANSTGAVIGALGSSILLYFIQTETRINFWLYSAIGITSCFVIGYLSSLVFRGKKDIQGLTIFSINKKLHERHTTTE